MAITTYMDFQGSGMTYKEKGIEPMNNFEKTFDERQTEFYTLQHHLMCNGFMVCFPANGTNGHKKVYVYTDEDFLQLNKNHRPALARFVGVYQYQYAKNPDSMSENTILRNKIEVLKEAINHLGLDKVQMIEIVIDEK